MCVCRVQRKFPFCALSDDKIKQRKEHIILSESLARTRLITSLIRTPKSVILTQIWLCKCLFLTLRERLSSLYFVLKIWAKTSQSFITLTRKHPPHKTRFLLSYYICFLLLRNTTRGRQTRKKQTRALFIPHAVRPYYGEKSISSWVGYRSKRL